MPHSITVKTQGCECSHKKLVGHNYSRGISKWCIKPSLEPKLILYPSQDHEQMKTEVASGKQQGRKFVSQQDADEI